MKKMDFLQKDLVVRNSYLIFVESNEREKIKNHSQLLREKSIKISLTNLVVRNSYLIFVKSNRNKF
jgi:hypothetical protein